MTQDFRALHRFECTSRSEKKLFVEHAARPAEDGFDRTVDAFDETEADAMTVVSRDPVEVAEQGAPSFCISDSGENSAAAVAILETDLELSQNFATQRRRLASDRSAAVVPLSDLTGRQRVAALPLKNYATDATLHLPPAALQIQPAA